MKIPVLSAAIVAAVVVSTVLGDTVPEQVSGACGNWVKHCNNDVPWGCRSFG